MKNIHKKISTVVSLAVLFSVPMQAQAKEMTGKEVAFDRKLGNCLGCHAVDGGNLPGNAGPPLIAMQARYPDKSKLRDQIWDATVRNPNSLMPPFGKHKILSEEQVDKITDYIHSL